MQDPDQDLDRYLQRRWKAIINCTDYRILVGLVAGAVVLAIILWPVFLSARPKSHLIACHNNIKQLGQAMLLYTADWDEHRPSAEHWGDEITKYVDPHSDVTSLFHCPVAVSPYSYAFNRRLGNLGLKQIEAPIDTVQIFEADVSSINASGDRSLLPMTPRHNDGLNIGFVDGHTKFHHQTDLLHW